MDKDAAPCPPTIDTLSPLNVKNSRGRENIVLDKSSREDDTITLSRNVGHMFSEVAPNSKERRLHSAKT